MSKSANEKVRERWSHVEYVDLDRSPEKQQKAVEDEKPIIVDLTSDAEETADFKETDDEDEQELLEETWCMKLVRSQLYDGEEDASAHNDMVVDLSEVLGEDTLKTVYLFSFQFEMDWLLQKIAKHVEIVIIAQEGTVLPATRSTGHKVRFRMLRMPNFCSHHSKLIVAFHRNRSCQLMIPSNNFTCMETNIPQQVMWFSPMLRYVGRGSNSMAINRSPFRAALIRYLQRYPNPIRELIESIQEVDFLPLDDTGAQFIFSAPGGTPDDISGLSLLHEALGNAGQEHEGKHRHYFCQTSSIGSPLNYQAKGDPKNIFTNIMVPLFAGLLPSLPNSLKQYPGAEVAETLKQKKIHAHILYPTVQEFTECAPGWLAGGWFHFHHAKGGMATKQYDFLAKNRYFVKQSEYELHPGSVIPLPIIKRDKVPCHTKYYMMFTSDDASRWGHNCEWALFTTANLSGHAWGTPPSYKPKNYECGVLYRNSGNTKLRINCAKDLAYPIGYSHKVNDRLPLSQNTKIINIMLPYWLPAPDYDISDDAFCASSTNYTDLDINGRSYETLS